MSQDLPQRDQLQAAADGPQLVALANERKGPAAPITEQQARQLWQLAGEAHNRVSAFEWFQAGILAAELFHQVIEPAADQAATTFREALAPKQKTCRRCENPTYCQEHLRGCDLDEKAR